MECGEPFYKKIACLYVLNPLSANPTKWSDTLTLIFISQHFDWVLCILSKCDWMNNLKSSDVIIVKKVRKCIKKQ